MRNFSIRREIFMELDRLTMEMAKETGKIDYIVETIADRLVHNGNFRMEYAGHSFYFQEYEFANPMDFSSTTMISVILPEYIARDIDFNYGVSYDSTYGKNSKTTYLNRCKSCMELAKEFVYKVLPKVDYWIKKEVNNMEIDNILEVLE